MIGRAKKWIDFGTACLFTVIFLLHLTASSLGQSSQVADRTLEAVDALNEENWKQIAPGLKIVQARTETGVVISAFEFSMNRFDLRLELQADPKGDRAHEIGERTDAFFVINAGFFLEDEENRLAPVGLLSSQNEQSGKKWGTAGGYLVLDEKISIRPTRAGAPRTAENFVQSKPVLIEPGKIWAMNTNQEIRKRRTLVCVRDRDTILVLLVTGSGMSLFEAGWLLRARQWGGFFDCDSAIAMDGGGSSQSWMRDHKQYSLRGATPVHNFLVFRQRKEN